MNIRGPQKSRAYRASQEEGKLCYECYQAKQAAERAEKNAASASANQEAGLPALTGSAKQIPWADSIRAEKIAEIDAIEFSPKASAANLAKGAAAIAEIKSMIPAGWWIDNRSNSGWKILSAIVNR